NTHEIRIFESLGSILRGHKRYAEVVEYYARAIALISQPEQKDWTYFYSRGACYEWLKKWPQAEADLQRALQLSPDQPLVLNTLGYYWINQNKNLKQGLALIEKAARLKPDDGDIVESLGWAHYRAGNIDQALEHLRRATELRPSDPTFSDHYGDVLWKKGRKQQARGMWTWAMSLDPAPTEAEKIKRKIANGLEQ